MSVCSVKQFETILKITGLVSSLLFVAPMFVEAADMAEAQNNTNNSERIGCSVFLAQFDGEIKSKDKRPAYRYCRFRWVADIKEFSMCRNYVNLAFNDSQLTGPLSNGKHVVRSNSYWIVSIPDKYMTVNNCVVIEDGGLRPYSNEKVSTILNELYGDSDKQRFLLEQVSGMVHADAN